jgi:branched-chain amino acid transport system substrate-binding protein
MSLEDSRRSVSRREFLRLAGSVGAGAALAGGLAGGMAAVLGGCAGSQDTTTTAGPTTTAASAPTTAASADTSIASSTTAAPTTTSVGAAVEEGPEVKAGYVLPITGGMAPFGAILQWQIDWFNRNAWMDGLVMGDGKRHKLTVILRDTQSDTDRAAQVAQALIQNDKVVLIGAAAGAGNVLPVSEVAEDFGCPCVTYDCPGDAWNTGQPEGGFKWCWHSGFVLRDLAINFLATWDALDTNKVVGGLYPNDGDGTAFADALPLVFQAKGYSYVDPGRFADGTRDFTALIAELREQGVEIVSGIPTSADFATFWRQAMERGFRPKVSTQARALLFRAGVDALGDLGDGQTMECWFHPSFPYTSTVTGLTPKQVCDQWEGDTGEQWGQPLCLFSQFELWTDILTRCKDPSEKDEIVAAIKQTKTTTIGGPVDWTVNPEPYSGFYNFATKPIAAGQWVKGAGGRGYGVEIVASATQPDIKTTAAARELAFG